MSLWADYKKERAGIECIETGEGFVTYSLDGSECYIRDIYIIPDCRKSHLAATLADRVISLAKEAGCTTLTGTVDTTTNGATDSLKVLLAYGMSLHSVRGNVIIFIKDI